MQLMCVLTASVHVSAQWYINIAPIMLWMQVRIAVPVAFPVDVLEKIPIGRNIKRRKKVVRGHF